MIYDVIWSPEAKSSPNKNIDYLAEEWSVQVLKQFLEQVEVALKKIKLNPQAYPPYKKSSKCSFL